MNPAYADGASFRQALEARLKRTAESRAIPLNPLRQKVVMERLLARLFASPDAPWRLKGGFAMELRLAGRARTTRDLDLSAAGPAGTPSEARDPLLEALRDAALLDLGDFLEFAVADPGLALEAGLAGGYRFPVRVSLGGRPYASFHVDVGLDAAPSDASEVMVCEDHLAFAAIAPARVLLVPRERQFAEKLHAFTRPWGDRTNTRSKDLVDLLLLLKLGLSDRAALHRALESVFGRPGSHPLPQALPAPPGEWAEEYAAMAAQVGLSETTLGAASERLRLAWDDLGSPG